MKRSWRLRRVLTMLVLGMALGTALTLFLVGAAHRESSVAIEAQLHEQAMGWEHRGRADERGLEAGGATSAVTPR